MLDVLKTAVNVSNEFLNIFNILLLRKQCPCNTSFLWASTGGPRCWKDIGLYGVPFQAEMKLGCSHLENFANAD